MLLICIYFIFSVFKNCPVESSDVFLMSSRYCVTNSKLPIVSNFPLIENYDPPQEIESTLQTILNNSENSDIFEDWDKSWTIKKSIHQADKFNEIILDRRWETLKTRYLKAPTPGESDALHFESIGIPIDLENFKIPISTRSKELHIFLCTDRTVSSKCLWFLLQAFMQNKTAIRYCLENKIPTKNRVWANGECSHIRKELIHNTENLFLFEDHWSNIVVEKQNLDWKILYDKKEVITYKGTNEKYNFMLFHAKTINGLLKIHDYDYFYSETSGNKPLGPELPLNVTCIKFFVKMCDECMMDVTVMEEKKIGEKLNIQVKWWTEIHITLLNRTNRATMYFNTKTKNGANQVFWAVNGFASCNNDYRWIPKKQNSSCELVNGFGNLQITYEELQRNDVIVSDDTCNVGKLGNNGTCLACPDDICGTSKYCGLDEQENVHCYCPSGTFPGKNRCKNSYPLFKHPPKIYNIKPTSVEVIMEDLTLNLNLRQNQFKNYVIQYKDDNAKDWTDVTTLDITQTYQGTISNLTPNTKYEIRAKLMFRKTRGSRENLDKIETFNTPCTEITYNQVETKSKNTSIELIFKDILPENCNYKNYSVLNPNKTTERNNHSINVLHLLPYTDYVICLGRQSKCNLNINVKTEEGIPSQVGPIKISSVTSTNATLSWEPPKYPNGNITHYVIDYKLIKSRISHCPLEKKNNFSLNQTRHHKSIQIIGLEPYKIYSVKVVAFTKKGQGLPNEENKFGTAASDLIPNEIDLNISTHQRTAVTDFKYDKCSLQGPIIVYANVTCLSIWCKNETTMTDKKDVTETNLYTIENLIPYTNYSVTFFICNEVFCKPFLKNKRINTETSEPNIVRNVTVYSKNETYLALRWLPPYPPYSEVASYTVTYECDEYERKDDFIECKEYCSIWTNYICCPITYHIKSGYIYDIKVYTVDDKNQHSEAMRILNFPNTQEAPGVPENTSASWSKEDKLIISWNHPFIPNDWITKFVYIINGVKKEYNVIEEKLTYNVTVSSIPAELELTIKIQACSHYACSSQTQTKTTSPPPVPKMEENHFHFLPNNETINITLPKIENVCKKCYTVMQVAISKGSSKYNDSYLDFNQSVIFEYNSSYSNNTFLIGSGHEMTSRFLNKIITNPPLIPRRYYTLSIRVINSYKNKRRELSKSWIIHTNGFPKTQLIPSEGKNTKLFYLILLLLPIIAFGLYFVTRKKNYNNCKIRKPYSNMEDNYESLYVQFTPSTSNVHINSANGANWLDKIPGTNHSKPVLLYNVEDYARTNFCFDGFKNDFEMFPKGQLFSCLYAKLEENKLKNRNPNILPYDYSRVKLEKTDDDFYSDYINASYIDGYNTKNAYIATQWPIFNTLNDFWRMIWQKNVSYIVMVANLYENGEQKFELYWPNLNEQVKFDKIIVSFVSEDIFPNYVVRQFIVRESTEEIRVTQLHFSTWSDLGIPYYCQSLVPFLKKMLDITISEKSPIVVHCCDGVGRTGIIILCDMTLRLAQVENKIDIVNCLDHLRSRRQNMVESYVQYNLVHLVVLEYLLGKRTEIFCNEELKIKIKLIIENELDEQLKYLIDTEWVNEATKTLNNNDCTYLVSENLPSNSVISDFDEPLYLTPLGIDGPSSSYMDGAYVSGYLDINKFIATQYPGSEFILDFWKLVLATKSTIIVSLIDVHANSICKFWPDNNEVLNLSSGLKLKHYSTKDFDILQLVCLNIEVDNQTRLIKILFYKNWPLDKLVPNDIGQFVSFMEKTESLLRKSSPVIVTCPDGSTGCGIFLAMSFIIEKIKLEHKCDVCQAVRYIRQNRKQFVSDKDQFIFLYNAAIEYVEGFQAYGNFCN